MFSSWLQVIAVLTVKQVHRSICRCAVVAVKGVINHSGSQFLSAYVSPATGNVHKPPHTPDETNILAHTWSHIRAWQFARLMGTHGHDMKTTFIILLGYWSEMKWCRQLIRRQESNHIHDTHTVIDIHSIVILPHLWKINKTKKRGNSGLNQTSLGSWWKRRKPEIHGLQYWRQWIMWVEGDLLRGTIGAKEKKQTAHCVSQKIPTLPKLQSGTDHKQNEKYCVVIRHHLSASTTSS